MNGSLYLEEAFEQDAVEILWRFSVGASGALTNKKTKGMKSVVRNSAGSYTFTLTGTYPGGMVAGAGGTIGAISSNGAVGNVTVDSSSSTTTPTVTMVFVPLNSVTPTDPTNGVDIWVNLILKNGIV